MKIVWSAQRRLRKGRKGGYTLVELGVVAIIATILLAISLRWVLSLISATNAGSARVATLRDTTVVTSVFTADATAARGCLAAGLDGPVASYSPTSISFYADVTGPSGVPDGVPDLVSWQLTGSRIQRSVIDGSGVTGCSFGTPTTWLTVAERVRAAGDGSGGLQPVFTLYRNGVALSVTDLTGSCTGSRASGCLADAVGIHLMADGVSSNATSEVYNIIPLYSGASKLGR